APAPFSHQKAEKLQRQPGIPCHLIQFAPRSAFLLREKSIIQMRALPISRQRIGGVSCPFHIVGMNPPAGDHRPLRGKGAQRPSRIPLLNGQQPLAKTRDKLRRRPEPRNVNHLFVAPPGIGKSPPMKNQSQPPPSVLKAEPPIAVTHPL